MKRLIIYGATSLLSIEFIKKYKSEIDEFLLIARNKSKLHNLLKVFDDETKLKIKIFQKDLLELEENIEFIKSIEDKSILGIIFLIGETGDPNLEFKNYEECLKNYNTNLINPVILINNIIPKIENNGFVCVFSSLAGIRGRALRLFYCSAKAGLISYLSGLRQKLSKENINIVNVIAGYMNTEKFELNANTFLVTDPSVVAERVYKGIKVKKEIIYTSKLWHMISIIIQLIPEKIFKKLNF